MNIALYSPSLVLLIVLSYLVLKADKKSKKNIVFALLSFSAAIWVFCVLMADTSKTYESAFFWSQIAILGPAFLPSLILYFSWIFPRQEKTTTFQYLLLALPPILILPFIFSDANVQEIYIHDWGTELKTGWVYYLLFFFYVFYPIIGFRNLIKKYKNEVGVPKQQLRLIIIGLGISLVIGITTNLLLVIIGDNGLSILGPPSTLFLVGFTAYAIIRHRFLDTRFLLGKILYYLVLSILPYGIFYIITAVQNYIFGSIYEIGSYMLGIVFAVLFVIFFNWIHNFIRKSIDSNIINPGYSPLETVDELSNQVATSLDINEIGEKVLSTISKTIRPVFESLIIIPGKDQAKEFVIEYNHKSKLSKENFSSALEIWKVTGKDPIVFDEIQQELFSRYAQEQAEINKLKVIMEKHQIKVLVPLGQKEEVSGILVLGMKEADSPYTVQDIEFLKSLANTTRVAVERSLFYEEVVDLNRNLQKKVEDATKELQIKNTDLQGALDVIKEVQRRERDMIDIMGHELRTPITIVRNALSLLNSGIENNKEVPHEILVKYIKMAVESAEREVGLIETLLSATKVDAQRLQLFRENVDFNDVIHDAMLALRTRAQAKDLEIRFKEPAKLPEVYADRTRIQEVVDNLLSNAIKYTEKGYIEITLEAKGKFLQCSVIDTGLGIPKEDLANLGKKFYRVQTHTNDGSAVVRPGGTGLGLYVTFEIIKGHGGEVKVTSEVGKGSNFSFTVPLYKDQKIEKPMAKMEKDIFKRMGKKTKAQIEKDSQESQKTEKREESKATAKSTKPRQREIAD